MILRGNPLVARRELIALFEADATTRYNGFMIATTVSDLGLILTPLLIHADDEVFGRPFVETKEGLMSL